MPFYRFVLVTPLPPEEVMARLSRFVRDPPDYREASRRRFHGPDPNEPPFVGKIFASHFRISANKSLTWNQPAMIWGWVKPASDGSRLHIVQFLHPGVLYFTAIWLLMLPATSNQPIISPVNLMYLYLGIIHTLFFREARKNREFFTQNVAGATPITRP